MPIPLFLFHLDQASICARANLEKRSFLWPISTSVAVSHFEGTFRQSLYRSLQYQLDRRLVPPNGMGLCLRKKAGVYRQEQNQENRKRFSNLSLAPWRECYFHNRM